LVLVLLGWYGAAHSPFLFQQIPYLVSGGVLGMAFVIAGGFCYFGFWLTKLVYEGREQNEALLAALERVEARLGPVGMPASRSPNGVSPGGSPAGPADEPANGSAPSSMLVATASGTMMHRPDCSIVAGKDGLREVSPGDSSLKPCRICEPTPQP
ncbi:MAG: hypothetical protein QOG64_2569, partial [Acidimicrobiaceae bacterium]|nr:hypothetical protein [Acidimicrobiaceae bacterium]